MPGHPSSDTETPAKLTRGPKWAREAYNALLAFVIRERIVSVNRDGGEITKTQTGKLLKVKPASTTRQHPFHVQAAGGLTVRVFYGTVNGIRTIEMSPADNPPAILTLRSTDTILWLQVDTNDSHLVSEVSIDSGASLPADDEEGGTYYLALADLAFNPVSGSSGFFLCVDNLTGSQTFSMCRNWFSNPATYGATWSVI